MYKEWPHNWEPPPPPQKKINNCSSSYFMKVEALLFLFDQFLVNKTTQEVGELAELIIGKSNMGKINIKIQNIKWNSQIRKKELTERKSNLAELNNKL